MRIQLRLKPTQYPAYFPANQHTVASLIYEIIARGEPALAGFLHDRGYQVAASPKRFKFFVFSLPQLPRYRFVKDHYVFDDGYAQLQIASPLPSFLTAFTDGVNGQKNINLGGREYVLEKMEMLPPPAFTEEMRFVAISPITVSLQPEGCPTKYYVRAYEEQFASLVVSNLREKYRTLTGGDCRNDELEFAFDWDYIERRGGVERVSKLILYKDIRIKGYLAPFYVRGNPTLIELGWECGFGNSNSQGFGMAGW